MEHINKLKSPITDLDLIKKWLPHREPMIMVDALLFFDDNKGIATLFVETENLFFMQGELSETGLIEHMAQTAALHFGYKFYTKNTPAKEGFIASIKSFQLSELPKENDTITTEAIILYEVAGMTMVKMESFVNGMTIASAEMTTVLKNVDR